MLLRTSLPGLPAVVVVSALAACSTQSMNPLRTDVCFQGYVDEMALEEQLRATQDCCGNLGSLPVQAVPEVPTPTALGPRDSPLPATQTTPTHSPFFATLTRVSPVYTFPQGKSRFAAFDLSSLPRQPRTLTILPRRSGLTSQAESCIEKQEGPAETYRYFRPLATFLGSERQPIAAGLPGAPAQVQIYAGLRYDVPADARFVVIHSSPQALGTRLRLQGGSRIDLMPVPGTLILLPTPVDGSIDGVVTSTGALEIHVE